MAQRVAELAAEQDAVELVVDPAFITDFITACGSAGLAVWRYEGPGKPEGRGLKIISHAQEKKISFEDRQL